MSRIPVLAITGQSLSGKSTLAKMFKDEGDCSVIEINSLMKNILHRTKVIRLLNNFVPQQYSNSHNNSQFRKNCRNILLPFLERLFLRKMTKMKNKQFCVVEGIFMEHMIIDRSDISFFMDADFQSESTAKKQEYSNFIEATKEYCDFVLFPDKIKPEDYSLMVKEARKAILDPLSLELWDDYSTAIRQKHTWRTSEGKCWRKGELT